MKRIRFYIALILILSCAGLTAQGRMTHEERVKQYQERLKLTSDQIKKVDEILIKSEKKMEKMRGSGDRENFREEMMKINQESTDEIEKILKPGQKEELKKMIEERKSRMQNWGGRNRQQ